MVTISVRFARQLVEGSPARPVLPDWHELFAAFCGHLGEEPGTHPITACARALAELHQANRRHPNWPGFEATCRALIASIDEWVRLRTPHPNKAGESLGELIAEMALAQVTANDLLRQCVSVDEVVHAAWKELAAMAGRWSDLVAAVIDGQQPPDPCNPKATN